MTEPTRVLIADDDEQIRAGLRLMLATQNDLEVVGEAVDGAEAIAETARLTPDVVLMDIRMPGMDGLEATRRIAGAGSQNDGAGGTRVIILTTFEQDEYVYEALRMGASGFLLKRTTPEALIEAIRVVVSGDALLYPPITRRLITHFARPEPYADESAASDLDRLTERERDVLVEMARGRSNAEIAERLFVSEQTVKTHIRHIFAKLGFRDRAQAVVFAYENGLVRAGEPRDA
jgi:DNA-binding NarL/FixJ family response regulator